MIRNIIWDFDGTLFDTYPAIVYSFVSVLKSDYLLTYDPIEIERLVRIDTGFCSQKISHENGLDSNEVLKKVRNFYNEQTIITEKPHEHSIDICAKISKLGSNILITHRDKHSTDNILQYYDMLKLFDLIITADDEVTPKPSLESFNIALKSMEIRKCETIGVGDRDLDVQAALNAGIKSVYFNPDGFVNTNATYNIRSLSEINVLLSD